MQQNFIDDKSKSNFRFQELDALRGIAALFVLFFHYSISNSEILTFCKYGVTGVDLFFLISGFVIFMSVSKAKNGGEFLINRFTRLFPTYWVAVIFTFILINITNNLILVNNTPTNWEGFFL